MRIFDSLTHPDFGRENLILERIDPRVVGALAVPLPGFAYDADQYVSKCIESKFYKPVALLNLNVSDIEGQIRGAKKKGFVGLKVHPRFSGWAWTDPSQKDLLDLIFSICQDVGLPILFCTYFSSEANLLPKVDPIIKFADLLDRYPKIKLLLMHGGGHRLLDFVELARFNKNVLLDLSFTLMKFQGSSVDLDLTYALKNFNKRICFGSDAPYFEPNLVISRLELLLFNINPNPEYAYSHEVWSKNILEFLQF